MKEHIIFFDHTCKLCSQAVQTIQAKDKNQIFEFFPLESEMAKQSLPEKYLSMDTLVLLENKKEVWVRAKAIFRILHLLEGKWGWLVYIPGLDLFYRLIARNRHFIVK